jgi:hypothetical protein
MDLDVAETVVSDATRIMTSVPEFYEEIFGIDMPVQFRVDAEVGPNMKDLH